MLLLKSCPHCHGDLSLEQDRRCTYLECVQCGHVLSVTQERALGVRVCRRGLVHCPASQPATTPGLAPAVARRERGAVA
jgi:hypothetical protein